MNLNDLAIGQSARITSVGGEGSLRRHLLDMGLLPGASVTLVGHAPMGDPVELRLYGYDLALRRSDAAQIEVTLAGPSEKRKMRPVPMKTLRPRPTDPLPEVTRLTFALVGNQNCGKTTLFNQLTGADQHVGNLPGVTVDKKSGGIRGYENTEVTDLPGIYSLSPYSAEETVSRDFLLDEKPTGIINIADATNLGRSLSLTLQLLELDVPTVLALNMMDEVRAGGGSIDAAALEALLGVPVVPISAVKNEGVDDLIRRAVHAAQYRERPMRQDFAEGAVRRCLDGIARIIGERDVPVRFTAEKLAEGDASIAARLRLSEKERERIEGLLVRMEKECGTDRAAAIAEMRFSFIDQVTARTVVRPREDRRSRRIDRVLTGKYTAIPAFLLIMAAVFFLTFRVVGAWMQGILQVGIDAVAQWTDALLTRLAVHPTVHALMIDGVFGGVGSVLSFVPVIVVLFFFLSLLEDSGYMARIAFIADRPLQKIGLSGRSIVPMLIGFGCTVPAVMAARTLPSARDRRLTILLTPFMSCTAKLPVYGFFAQAFFPKISWLITAGLYLLGIGMGILVALLLKGGASAPFVMELPTYRLPTLKNTARLLWDKAKDFLQRAFTVIFLCAVAVWALQNFDFRLTPAAPEQSILAAAAGRIAPIFRPMGFGDWRIVTALFAGFLAKESVVSTLSVLAGGNVSALLTPAAALSLRVFCLLYTPCVAAVSAIRREVGTVRAFATVVLQCGIAYFASLLVALLWAVM